MGIGGPLAAPGWTPRHLTPYSRTDLIPRDDPHAAEMAPQVGLEPAAWSLTLHAASRPPCGGPLNSFITVLSKLAPQAGLEPATIRLTVGRSTN